jgi:hypothetical protein
MFDSWRSDKSVTALTLGFFAAAALFKVRTGGRPARMKLDGRPTDHFTFRRETGVMTFDLPAGEIRFEFTHEP